MALLGSQEGVVEDRRHTHPPDQSSAGRPGWREAEQFEPVRGVAHVTSTKSLKRTKAVRLRILGFWHDD